MPLFFGMALDAAGGAGFYDFRISGALCFFGFLILLRECFVAVDTHLVISFFIVTNDRLFVAFFGLLDKIVASAGHATLDLIVAGPGVMTIFAVICKVLGVRELYGTAFRFDTFRGDQPDFSQWKTEFVVGGLHRNAPGAGTNHDYRKQGKYNRPFSYHPLFPLIFTNITISLDRRKLRFYLTGAG